MRMRAAGPLLVLLVCSACSESPQRGDGPTSDRWHLDQSRADTAGPASERGSEAGPPLNLLVVKPTEIDDLVANPGMGWQTFHQVATSDQTLAGLPSGSAYYRWNWRDLQPTEANIKTSIIADTLAKARAAGQTLMFRVMTTGDDPSYNAPDWLAGAGCKVLTFQASSGGPSITAPDLDDATCFAKHAAFITALGKALAAEAEHLQVDIGSVGLWGEWHFSGTIPQIPMPSLATKKKLVDLYFQSFPDSPLQALIGDVEALAYATSLGSGWRADCFGDYGFFSSTWNHMDNLYKQNVAAASATEAWKKGPVAWESCWYMSKWVDAGYDVQKIFGYGLDLHGSFLNNKSTALPAGAQYRQYIEAFLKKLGYRFVLRELRYPEAFERGRKVPVTMSWDSIGVAPCYADFHPAVQLTPKAGGTPVVFTSTASVRQWLPGTGLPASLELLLDTAQPAGAYNLDVGIVNSAGTPVLRLAIAGRDPSGWYPLTSVTVK
jgi:hypothetical protein